MLYLHKISPKFLQSFRKDLPWLVSLYLLVSYVTSLVTSPTLTSFSQCLVAASWDMLLDLDIEEIFASSDDQIYSRIWKSWPNSVRFFLPSYEWSHADCGYAGFWSTRVPEIDPLWFPSCVTWITNTFAYKMLLKRCSV